MLFIDIKQAVQLYDKVLTISAQRSEFRASRGDSVMLPGHWKTERLGDLFCSIFMSNLSPQCQNCLITLFIINNGGEKLNAGSYWLFIALGVRING